MLTVSLSVVYRFWGSAFFVSWVGSLLQVAFLFGLLQISNCSVTCEFIGYCDKYADRVMQFFLKLASLN